ncbi:MAG: hypothetical protein WDO73_17600 [Ignavibacteriota bacterium]
MDCGTEIRLFDPKRNPRNWTDLIRPTDCAVFLKHRTTSSALTPDGQPFRDSADVTCIVFERLDVAQRFCEAKVQALPHIRCEIYDAQGLARPPLLTIINPDLRAKEQTGSIWSRRRKLIAGGLGLASIPLFWVGMVSSTSSDLAVFLAINCLVLALRFLYWDFGLKNRRAGAAQTGGSASQVGTRRCLS